MSARFPPVPTDDVSNHCTLGTAFPSWLTIPRPLERKISVYVALLAPLSKPSVILVSAIIRVDAASSGVVVVAS
jgi:hypothetical protein